MAPISGTCRIQNTSKKSIPISSPEQNYLSILDMRYPVQGYYKVFIHLKCAICGQLVYVKIICNTNQIFIGIKPIFSENFIQINQVWPQLQLKMWSQAIFRIYTGFDHFYHWRPPKCILEAAIDKLEIQFGKISPFNQYWISSLSMAFSKNLFWRLQMIQMVQTCVNSENGFGSRLRL